MVTVMAVDLRTKIGDLREMAKIGEGGAVSFYT
jgi:hypothetical protein